MGTLGVVGVAALALLILPGLAVPASAAPVPLGASAPQQWAYGGQKWANVTIDLPNATYTSHAFFGWQVIFSATNTSATTVELEASRTMAGHVYAQYCSPNCSNATTSGNLSLVGWEQSAGFANLTTAGTVYVGGSPTAAIALANASSRSAGNLTESFTFSTGSGAAAHSTAASLDVAGNAHAEIDFATPLGLVPYNATTGERWNDSAAFTAAGAWAISGMWSHTSFLGTTGSGHLNASGAVQANGTVSVQGYDAGNVTLANNQTLPVIVLSWNGPFDDEDGVILVPHDFDMFGGSTHAWSSDSLGDDSVATAELDLHVDAAHHLKVVATASDWAASDGSLSTSYTAATGTTPAAASSPALVQAQPESVAQAQQASGCLMGGCGAPSGHGVLGGSLGVALLVGLIAVVVVGTVAVVSYRTAARRRTSTVPPGAIHGNVVPPAPPAGGPGEPPRSP